MAFFCPYWTKPIVFSIIYEVIYDKGLAYFSALIHPTASRTLLQSAGFCMAIITICIHIPIVYYSLNCKLIKVNTVFSPSVNSWDLGQYLLPCNSFEWVKEWKRYIYPWFICLSGSHKGYSRTPNDSIMLLEAAYL